MDTHPAFTPSAELYPFTSRWFDSNAGRVHCVDERAGRPILMCHGNPTWSFLHRHVIRRLRGRFRCIAPDYPGSGLSDRPPGYGYTPGEHTRVVEQLVRALDLHDLIVELPHARHFFVEDAPGEVADAVVARFAVSSPRAGAG